MSCHWMVAPIRKGLHLDNSVSYLIYAYLLVIMLSIQHEGYKIVIIVALFGV